MYNFSFNFFFFFRFFFLLFIFLCFIFKIIVFILLKIDFRVQIIFGGFLILAFIFFLVRRCFILIFIVHGDKIFNRKFIGKDFVIFFVEVVFVLCVSCKISSSPTIFIIGGLFIFIIFLGRGIYKESVFVIGRFVIIVYLLRAFHMVNIRDKIILVNGRVNFIIFGFFDWIFCFGLVNVSFQFKFFFLFSWSLCREFVIFWFFSNRVEFLVIEVFLFIFGCHFLFFCIELSANKSFFKILVSNFFNFKKKYHFNGDQDNKDQKLENVASKSPIFEVCVGYIDLRVCDGIGALFNRDIL